MRRRIAVLACLVVVLLLTACSKKQTEEEKRGPKGSFGYTKYRYEKDDPKKKVLVEEYEYLVTESTLTMYDNDGILYYTEHKYYDDTGERVLKVVGEVPEDKLRFSDKVSFTKEYDSLGRLVTDIRSKEGRGDEYYYDSIIFFEMYTSFPPRFSLLHEPLNGYLLMDDFPAGDIRKDYVYKGDTTELQSFTITMGDEKVLSIEFGEMDIVRSMKISGDDVWWEEVYDNATGTSRFEGGYESAKYSGTKTYDASGQCLYAEKDILYDDEYDSSFSSRLIVELTDDGYTQRIFQREGDQEEVLQTLGSYNSEGRCLFEEDYEVNDLGETYVYNERRFEYDDDGMLTRMETRYSWCYDGEQYNDETIYTFENTDTEYVTKLYRNGRLDSEERRSWPEIPDINGKVRCIVRKEVVDDPIPIEEEPTYNTTEEFAVYMPQMNQTEGEESWVMYSCVYDDGGIRIKTATSEFDDNGNLRSVERQENPYVASGSGGGTISEEYDEKGRICKRREVSVGKLINETLVWEYWEHE